LKDIFSQQRQEVLAWLSDPQKGMTSWNSASPETEFSSLLTKADLTPSGTSASTSNHDPNLSSLTIKADLPGLIAQALPVVMITLESWTRRMFERVRPVIGSYAQEAVRRLFDRLGFTVASAAIPPAPPENTPPAASPDEPRRPVLEAGWPVMNPKLSDAVDRLTLSFCEETNATTSLALSDALAKTREAIRDATTIGLPMEDLTKRINEIFDQAEQWRSKRIAVTESSRAVHMAQDLSARESGVVKGFHWLASGDACPLCEALGGKEVGLGIPFETGTSANPVYADVYHPPRHPGCQCSITEVLLPEGQRNGSLEELAGAWV
jgi:hypothetical protein